MLGTYYHNSVTFVADGSTSKIHMIMKLRKSYIYILLSCSRKRALFIRLPRCYFEIKLVHGCTGQIYLGRYLNLYGQVILKFVTLNDAHFDLRQK